MRDDDLTRALKSAVAQLDAPPPMAADDVLRAGALRRRRRQAGIGLSAAAAAIVAAILIVDPSAAAHPGSVTTAVIGAIGGGDALGGSEPMMATGARLTIGLSLMVALAALVLATCVGAIRGGTAAPVRARAGVVGVALGSAVAGGWVTTFFFLSSGYSSAQGLRWPEVVGVAVPGLVIPAITCWAAWRARSPQALAGSFALAATTTATSLWGVGTPTWWVGTSLFSKVDPYRSFAILAFVLCVAGLALWWAGVRARQTPAISRGTVGLVAMLQVVVAAGIARVIFGPIRLRIPLDATLAHYLVGYGPALAIQIVFATLAFAATAIAVSPRQLPRIAPWLYAVAMMLPFLLVVAGRRIFLLVEVRTLLWLSGGIFVLVCLLVWWRRTPVPDDDGADDEPPAVDALAD